MPPQISPEAIAKKLQEQAADDAIGLKASATPLPGPTRQAFSIVPDLKVGNFRVRRFVDGDIDILEGMDHPFGKLITAVMSGEKENGKSFVPRGKWARILCWQMTRDIDEVDKVIAEGGIEAVTEASAKIFRNSTLGDLAEVVTAITEQFNIYCAPVIGYGPADDKGEGENSPNPPSR